MLKGKKVAILGDRDGIPGQAIEECVKSAVANRGQPRSVVHSRHRHQPRVSSADRRDSDCCWHPTRG